jgi:hypothetical protein
MLGLGALGEIAIGELPAGLPVTLPPVSGLMGIAIVEAGFGNPGRRVEMVGY